MTILEQLEQDKATLLTATQAKLVEIDAAIDAIKRVESLGFRVVGSAPAAAKAPTAPRDNAMPGSMVAEDLRAHGGGPAPKIKPADTPEGVQRRAADLKKPILEYLKANGPTNTKAIARGLGVRISPTRAALYELESERAVHTVGQKRSQRWHLGPKVAVRPAVAPAPTLPSVPANRHLREDGVTVPPPESVKEATRLAKRYSHELGPFKASSAGAGSAFISRCKGCDTYVTIGRDGKVSGPGTRHECLAKAVGS